MLGCQNRILSTTGEIKKKVNENDMNDMKKVINKI